MFEGLQLPFDQALRVEQRYFAKVIQSDEAAAMIRSLFVSLQELNKLARRPAEVAAGQSEKSESSAPGFMGAGIATVTARAGIVVALLDRDAGERRQGQGERSKR